MVVTCTVLASAAKGASTSPGDIASQIIASSPTSSATMDTPTSYNCGSILRYTTSLTSASSENYYIFDSPIDSYMGIGLSPNNTNYYALLYQYQTSSDSYVATNIYVTAGNADVLNDLPAGNYLLDVFSTGTVGDSYSIYMNASNPANPTNTYIVTFDLMVFGYETGIDTTDPVDVNDLKYCDDYNTYNSVYVNGDLLFQNNSEIGASLDWEDDREVDTPETLNTLSQIVREVHFNPLGQFYHVSYSSN